MKFAIAKEHRDFFQKNGWIEFEDFLSEQHVHMFNNAIDHALSNLLAVPISQLSQVSDETLFLQGHDLWRHDQDLRKLIMQPRLGEIVSELIEKKPLRLGYDQLLPVSGLHQSQTKNVYSHFLQQQATLDEVSSLNGILCGLILALGQEENQSSEILSDADGINIFPSKPGHALFFQPDRLVQWNLLNFLSKQRFYMIVYTRVGTTYYLQSRDPHTHYLKHLGYIFNDRLKEKLNPIVYR